MSIKRILIDPRSRRASASVMTRAPGSHARTFKNNSVLCPSATMADTQEAEAPVREGVQTRKSNVTNRPGLRAMKELGIPVPGTTKRRTSQQVAADKKIAAEEKAAKDAGQRERIAKVARIELDMDNDDEKVKSSQLCSLKNNLA